MSKFILLPVPEGYKSWEAFNRGNFLTFSKNLRLLWKFEPGPISFESVGLTLSVSKRFGFIDDAGSNLQAKLFFSFFFLLFFLTESVYRS